jgi:hypothetical protein
MRLMNAIATKIQANLNLRVFLPLLVVALLTTWYGLFWSVAYFSALTGGLRFIDMQPTLTADKLFAQIHLYSPETIEFYLGWSLFDYLWPLVTFTTMCFISAWLFRFLSPKWQRWFPPLVASAYLTVLFDWAENIGFVTLVLGLPAEPMWLAQVTLLLHAGKLVFNMVFNIGFWIALVAAGVGKFRTLRA